MTKDEALDLALAALEGNTTNPVIDPDQAAIEDQAITAIKQARALDKKAENARELGLDYEPVGLIDRLTNPEDHYEFTDPKKANAVLMSLCQEAADALAAPTSAEYAMGYAEGFNDGCKPAPVQEPVAWVDLLKQAEEVVRSKSLWKKYIDGTPLANDIAVWMASFAQEHATPPAQPAVPDAIIEAGESPDYRDGWNDCRQTMLEMMK